MKLMLKTLATAALGASTLVSASAYAASPCSGGDHSNYYNFTAVENGTKISVNIQAFGGIKLPNKAIATVQQTMELTSDCKFSSTILVDLGQPTLTPVFTLTGSWSYPAESKAISFMIDGDSSAGASATGTWGALFDPNAINGMPQFFPVLINAEKEKIISPLNVIYPSVTLQKGYITLSKDGQTATITTLIGGKAIATSAKTEKSSEVKFSFGATTKATVSTVEPI